MTDEEEKEGKQRLQELLSEALDLTENKFSYANNVQLYFGINEVTLDMYYVGPNNKPSAPVAEAKRLQRTVLPIGIAKEMAELLLNGIAKWEADFGITLPLVPESDSNEGGSASEGSDE